MQTPHLETRLSCLPELDNSVISSILLLTWISHFWKTMSLLSGYTGSKCEKTISLPHLRRGPDDPFTETLAFLGVSQLECDACQVCALFPGRWWTKNGARGKRCLELPSFTAVYTPQTESTAVPVRFIFLNCPFGRWCLRNWGNIVWQCCGGWEPSVPLWGKSIEIKHNTK